MILIFNQHIDLSDKNTAVHCVNIPAVQVEKCILLVLVSFPSTALVTYVSLWHPRKGDNLIWAGDRTNPNAKRGLSPAPNGFPLCNPLSLSPHPLFPALHFVVKYSIVVLWVVCGFVADKIAAFCNKSKKTAFAYKTIKD